MPARRASLPRSGPGGAHLHARLPQTESARSSDGATEERLGWVSRRHGRSEGISELCFFFGYYSYRLTRVSCKRLFCALTFGGKSTTCAPAALDTPPPHTHMHAHTSFLFLFPFLFEARLKVPVCLGFSLPHAVPLAQPPVPGHLCAPSVLPQAVDSQRAAKSRWLRAGSQQGSDEMKE